MSFNLTSLAFTAGYYGFSMIIFTIGYKFASAGISSMQGTKHKPSVFYGNLRLPFLIVGFIFIAIVVGFGFMFLTNNPIIFTIPGMDIPPEFRFLIPQIFLPIMLTIMIIAFLYYIGRIFMSHGIEKQVVE